MSGVVDKHGQQWEHCCQCGDFVAIEKLYYAYSPKWPTYTSVDLCIKCFNKNHKLYIHRFTVLSNWRQVLWTDAVCHDTSLKQYEHLMNRFMQVSSDCLQEGLS